MLKIQECVESQYRLLDNLNSNFPRRSKAILLLFKQCNLESLVYCNARSREMILSKWVQKNNTSQILNASNNVSVMCLDVKDCRAYPG